MVTLFPGHAPEEVEKQVTIPIEIALSGVPHSVRMFSHTQFGLSFLTLTFDDQVDDYFARQRVLERLQQADLPPGLEPELAPLSTPIGELYRFRLVSATENATELRGVEDWVVERALKMTPGVADVVSRGGFVKQYQVNVDLAAHENVRRDADQVFTALGRGNANAGGNYLDQGEQQYLIRGIGLLQSPDDIGSIVVAEHGGIPLLIRDLADVSIGSVPRQGLVGRNDDDEIVEGIVLMRKGENPSEVLTAIKDRIAHLNDSVLPKDVKIVPFYDRAWLISTTLTTVFENLLEGAILVTIVLYVFLRNARAASIVAGLIPLALLGTFIGLRLRGIPANLLSLGAMDFGIIVDGAVIVVENVFRTLAERSKAAAGRPADRESIRQAILAATTQVGRPTLFSMLIIIVANIPIFTLQRQEGRIFAPMAYTVSSALVGSLLFSLTLVPLMCFLLLGRGVSHEENALVNLCRRLYRRTLKPALERPGLVIGCALVALAGALALVPSLGSEFLPELNEGTMWLNLVLPASVSVSEASKMCAEVRTIVRQFPEVTQVISQAGRPEDGTDPKPINMVEMFVDLKPPAQWTRKITREELASTMEDAVSRDAWARAGDLAADPRQRPREHLADRRPDRHQGIRRRGGDAARQGRGRAARGVRRAAASLARSSIAQERSRSCRSRWTGRKPRATA